MGVVSIPPYAEEQVEWYPRGGRSDEVRIVVDRKVCRLTTKVPLENDVGNPGCSDHRICPL
jgi:hypothetical protein